MVNVQNVMFMRLPGLNAFNLKSESFQSASIVFTVKVENEKKITHMTARCDEKRLISARK